MAPNKPTTTRHGRPVKTSAAQKNTNQNRADDAAKAASNKKKREKAAAKKKQRSENDADAAVLQNSTNTAPSAADTIANLTAQLKASQALTHTLKQKNRKLKKSARPPPGSTPAGEITLLAKPKGRFRIQTAMGLDDNRKLFTELQAGIHALAIEAKVDFDLAWSEQDPAVIVKVLRVAAERYSYLSAERFPRSWATSALLQRYINSVRGYRKGKATPDSGVNRRREKVTNVGRFEAQQRRSGHSAHSSPPPEEPSMDVDIDDVGNDGSNSPSTAENDPHGSGEDSTPVLRTIHAGGE
ncbi:hypothetical protein C8J57DRAFT_1732606 [Mycena rebaudengoi]|nr:hypothetical protein C8J57DRAFT_1732606 [Mycena rebaudengoi]